MACRAQSESVGVILLLVTVVVTVSVAGVLYLDGVPGGDARGSTLVDVSVTATANDVTVTHAGGDSAALDSLSVVVRNDSETRRYAVDAANVSGDGDARFEASERFTRAHDLGGSTLTVLVVHAPSNTVLDRTTLDITRRPLVADFTVTTANPITGEVTDFDATASRDGDDEIVAYRWDFGDGTTDSSSHAVSHTYPDNGTYLVTLTVENDAGETATASKTVNVGDATLILDGATLRDDGDGVVAPGDSVTVSSTVASAGTSVRSMSADASGFDAGTVDLNDTNGDGTYERTFTVGLNPTNGDQSLTVTATGDDGTPVTVSTGTLTVDGTDPTLSGLSLRDGDGNGVVNAGDTVTVRADATDLSSSVASVTVDASAFDAGTVDLNDTDGDGTYEKTFTVGPSPGDGDQSATVIATDTGGNDATASTATLRVDTTAPTVEQFAVSDESVDLYWLWWEQYQTDWTVSDVELDSVMVSVNRTDASGNPQATYSGDSGTDTYSRWGNNGQYVVTIRASDIAGNERCVVITDTADGNPNDPITSFTPCT